MQRKLLILVAVISFFVGINANPAVQVHFNRIVNSDECLKNCMGPVRESNLELSIFKRTNYSDYLLNLDQICSVITDARHCIDNCRIVSNPFALISMNAICSNKIRQDVELLTPCLQGAGVQVQEQCEQTCGDYEALNDRLHMDTSTLKPEDQTAIQELNSQTNNACSVLKCSARCAVTKFNEQCGQLSNGEFAGNMIRKIIDHVLSTHRMDLEVFGLLETMKKTTQPECSYLHTADVLFDPFKDMISRQVTKQEDVQSPQVDPEQQLKLTVKQLNVQVLKKQLELLDKQLEIMNKQEQKMELPRFMQNPPPRQYEGEMF
jgi:hypothetical protein